uniref:FAD-binding FR-type domain-containing protein n=1 Tax=Grammatophora oceanica TaxID=210454 RepID=A0A7S1YCJ9_9STRA
MIILKLKRPALMCFHPGQYAFLKIKEIESQWHPFSIASGPQSEFLEFYIEVFDQGSWTRKLWGMLDGDGDRENSNKTVWVEVMGPYGTPLANVQDFSHVVSIGSGTGVVPMLSMLKQHVRHILRLEPSEYFRDLRQLQRDVYRLEVARQPRKGSLAQKLSSCWRKDSKEKASVTETLRHQVKRRLRSSITALKTQPVGTYDHTVTSREIKDATKKVTRLYYGVVALVVMPILGILLVGMHLSWCTLPFDKAEWMENALAICTCIFYGLFGVVATCFWDGNDLPAYMDFCFSVVGAFSCWYWFEKNLFGSFSTFDMMTYLMLTGYMTMRCWYEVVKPRHHSFRTEMLRSGINTVDKMEFVWVTRSAKLVSEIMPDINRIYDTLVEKWGEAHAARVLDIKVFVTDKDADAVRRLRESMENTNLYKNGHYTFGRPDLLKVIEDHTLDCSTKLRNSYTLLAFCGSPQLSHEIHRMKISNDISAAITGNKNHQMEYVSESYGGYKSQSGKKTEPQNVGDATNEEASVMTETTASPWRRTKRYDSTVSADDWQDEADEETKSMLEEGDIDPRLFEI